MIDKIENELKLPFSIYMTHNDAMSMKLLAHQLKDKLFIIVLCKENENNEKKYVVFTKESEILANYNKVAGSLPEVKSFDLPTAPLTEIQLYELIMRIVQTFSIDKYKVTFCADGNLGLVADPTVTELFKRWIRIINPKWVHIFSETKACRAASREFLKQFDLFVNNTLFEQLITVAGVVSKKNEMSTKIQDWRMLGIDAKIERVAKNDALHDSDSYPIDIGFSKSSDLDNETMETNDGSSSPVFCQRSVVAKNNNQSTYCFYDECIDDEQSMDLRHMGPFPDFIQLGGGDSPMLSDITNSIGSTPEHKRGDGTTQNMVIEKFDEKQDKQTDQFSEEPIHYCATSLTNFTSSYPNSTQEFCKPVNYFEETEYGSVAKLEVLSTKHSSSNERISTSWYSRYNCLNLNFFRSATERISPQNSALYADKQTTLNT